MVIATTTTATNADALPLFQSAKDIDQLTDKKTAIEQYKKVISLNDISEDANRAKEHAILKLGQIYRAQNASKELADLQVHCRTFLITLPKAKTAKIVRSLIDYLSEIPNSLELQVSVCKDAIQWAETKKRVFLRQALETRLAAMYFDNKMYSDSLQLISQLLRELKRLDDKVVLVDVQLLESRVYHALRNIAKSRASLTSARTSANSIYCPPLMQASLDMQSGILHAEEKDFKTAFSYFYETLEGFQSQEDPRSIIALKYMLLCKIMLNLPEDVHSLLQQKIANRYSGPNVGSMKAIADAMQNRNLVDFERALTEFKPQLNDDPVIRMHLAALYDKLLEQNLVRVIEPFSRVEIAHVAALVKLPQVQVEQKLSQLILDRKVNGVLDQGAGILIVFDDTECDPTYTDALETIKKMGRVVDSLYQKAATLC